MGVWGLTGYMHENQYALATTLVLSRETKTPPKPIVVDAWAFIFKLFFEAQHPWVYGGEYELFARDIATVVRGWQQMNLEPHFVFDGPAPAIKFPEYIRRIQEGRIQPADIFFHTPVATRNDVTFLRTKPMIPPLFYGACVSILRDLDVHCVWADSEGDFKCVELAASLGTWVVSADSDFTIFNLKGYAGYIPMDKMAWEYQEVKPETAPADEEHDGTSAVKPNGKWKAKSGRAPINDSSSFQFGLLPPSSGSLISIKFTIYHPKLLATHLDIPITFLPLLSSLVGNDFVPKSYRPRFWERGRPAAGFVGHVGSVLRDILHSGQDSRSRIGKRVANNMVSRGEMNRNSLPSRPSVATLIQTAIQELLLQPGNGAEIQEMVETVIDATLQYGDDSDPKGPFVSGMSASPHPYQDTVCSKYTEAYYAGDIPPRILQIVSSGTAWPNLFLEDPDVQSCSRTVGVELVTWVAAILNDGLNVGTRASMDSASSLASGSLRDGTREPFATKGGEEGENEPIDVIQELRRLREEQRPQKESQGRPPTSTARSPPTVASSNTKLSRTASVAISSPQPTFITAYYRLGLRIISQRLAIQTLPSLLGSTSRGQPSPQTSGSVKWNWQGPIQLQSLDLRMEVFMHAMQCNTIKIRTLDPDWVVFVAALRWTIMKLGGRAQVGGPRKSSDATKWKKSDAEAFLAACVQNTPKEPETNSLSSSAPLEATPRAIQLTAQVLTSIEATQNLGQALLLAKELKTRGAERRFSGLRFHALLAGEKHRFLSKEDTSLVSRLMEAVEEDGSVEWWGPEVIVEPVVPKWTPNPRQMQRTMPYKGPIGLYGVSSSWGGPSNRK